MGFYEDIVALTGVDYETVHFANDGTETPVRLSTGAIEAKTDVTDLKPESGLDVDETDIELTSGQFVSTYASESDLFIVSMTAQDTEPELWVHALKYDTLENYQIGLGFVLPSEELRV